MKKFNQFMSEANGYGDVNRQVASAQDKADRAQAKNVTSKGKKLGVLADPYSGKPTKQEVWEYKGKKWLVLGKSVEVFVPMKYHKVIKEDIEQIDENTIYPAAHLKRKGKHAGTIGSREYYVYQGIVYSINAKNVNNLGSIRHFKKTAADSLQSKLNLSEDVAANAAGGPLGSNPSTGSIAGYDPMLSKKPLKRSKFAGTECFEVDSDTFQKCHTGHGKYERWDKYLKDDCDTCKNIRAYAKRHPQKDIVIQRAGCGTMTYLKKKGVHY